ncbi:hypothetical protein KI387_004733, partial [Taxus chinensis]
MDIQCSQNLDDGELWLPADFLSDESPPKEIVMRTNINKPQIPSEFPYEWNSLGLPLDSSSYNSPVESVVGSTETESDEEDDYIAGLAHQIAHSMLDDDENSYMARDVQWASRQNILDTGKSNTMARSPQSILSAVGSWSTASSKGPSQVSSPPTTPLTENSDAWDLLYAAAGEVVRLEMDGFKQIPPAQIHAQGVLGAATRQNTTASQPSTFFNKDFQTRSSSFSGFPSKDRTYASQTLQRSSSDKTREEERKLLPHQYRHPKNTNTSVWGRQSKPTQVQHLQHRPGTKSGVGNRSLKPVDYSAPWPPLQQAGGSGMRAVFLGPNGSGRESGGTGVFLPRRVGNSSDLRRKPACSTVLLPSRIVQALNLNIEDINAQTGLQCSISHNYRDALTSTSATHPTAQYVGKPIDHCKRNGYSEHQNNTFYP